MSPSDAKLALCPIDAVPPGQTLRVETAGLTVAIYNVDGVIYVTDDACTHGPGSLSEGFLDGEVIECNFHQGCFNVRTGEVVSPPCIIPIKTYPVSVESGTVYLRLADS